MGVPPSLLHDKSTSSGYTALIIGATVTALILRALGISVNETSSSYLPAGVLVSYWTTISPPSLIASFIASIAGTVLIASNRSVLTAGVMIALALIPTISITGMALVAGDFGLAGAGIIRWLIDVAFVGIFSALIFLWKSRQVHQRKMRM